MHAVHAGPSIPDIQVVDSIDMALDDSRPSRRRGRGKEEAEAEKESESSTQLAVVLHPILEQLINSTVHLFYKFCSVCTSDWPGV